MRNNAVLAVGLFSAMLTACGSNQPEPVVEQIVIREPGEPAANATMQKAATEKAGGQEGRESEVDLVALGEDAFQACTGCHTVDKGARSMAGPNLYGVMGRKAASLDDFAYSEALSASGITWDYATLDRFLANPTAYVEGTSMAVSGARDDKSRAAILAYLAAQSE